jgi:aminoglycoside phosphotransferase (APT) family kinase protein
MMRSAHGEATVMKMTDRADGARRLAHEAEVLAALPVAVDDARLRQLLPTRIGGGTDGAWTYLVQARLPGIRATSLLSESATAARLIEEASTIAANLHERTGRPRAVNADDLAIWVDRPLAVVTDLAPGNAATVAALGNELRSALADRVLHCGLVHGDLWTDNLLVDPDSHRIVGIVDWDSADFGGLALHDQLHLVLYTRKVVRRSEIGAEICRALAEDGPVQELPLPAAARGGWEVIGRRAALALYWLRFVSSNLERQPSQTRRRRWVEANVHAVLQCL